MWNWKKRLAVLLAVCLLLMALAGCGKTPEADTDGTTTAGTSDSTSASTTTSGESSTTATTSGTTTTTTGSTTKPTTGTTAAKNTLAELLKSNPLKGISVPDESDDPLTFTLTKKSTETLQKRFDEYIDALFLVKDLKSLQTLDEKLSEIFALVHHQASVAQILYYADMSDSTAEADYTRTYEAMNEMQADAMNAYTDLYASKETYRKQFFKDWTEEELKMLVKLDDEIVAMRDRNVEIENEALDDSAANFETNIGKLYREFVGNGNAIAKAYGYANYYEYATDVVYGRDYATAERKAFRGYMFDEILTLYQAAVDAVMAVQDSVLNDEGVLMEVYGVLYAPYRYQKGDLLDNYLKTLKKSSADGMRHMFENERYLTANTESAYAGAFTTLLDDAYCFYGPDNQLMTTYVHELGHYYAYHAGAEEDLSLDLAEVHSQGNEMLFITYLEGKLSKAAYEYIRAYQIYYMCEVAMIATIEDAFEEAVYATDVSKYTTADFNKLMKATVDKYMPAEYRESFYEAMEWQWQHVAIPSAVYYLSYATSGMAALSVLQAAEADYGSAVTAYQKLAEDCCEMEFREALDQAGFSDPFEEKTYEELLKLAA